MFGAVADFIPVERALYPGSYVDLSASTAFACVTYVDTDARAARFFADADLVAEELAGRCREGAGREVRFLAADYSQPFEVDDGSQDLVISLFAGPMWDAVRRYLRPGGWLLANASHGDASLAALDPSLELIAVIASGAHGHELVIDNLGEYLIPKRADRAREELIRSSGRGVEYTRSAFAYLFAT